MSAFATLVRASLDLTLTDNFDDTETASVGGVTYTMRATLGVLANSVQLASGGQDGAADAEVTLNALADAINGGSEFSGAGAGTSYTAATTPNPHVVASRPSALVLRVTARVPGTIGNFITVAETHGEGAWTAGGTVLAGGTGDFAGGLAAWIAGTQLSAEAEQTLKELCVTGING